MKRITLDVPQSATGNKNIVIIADCFTKGHSRKLPTCMNLCIIMESLLKSTQTGGRNFEKGKSTHDTLSSAIGWNGRMTEQKAQLSIIMAGTTHAVY